MNDAKNYVVRQACQGFYPGQGCRFPTPCNNVATVAGNNTQGFVDGPAASAQFGALGGVSFSGTYTYMCDSQNHVIRTLDTFANVSTFAGTGTAGFVNGYRTTAQFNCPTEVAWDSTGNMYVADAGNNVIRKVDTAGNVTTFAGTGVAGYADGPGGSAQFNMPCGIFFDPADNFLYVADSGNNLIRRIDLAGNVQSYAGTTGPGLTDGVLSQAQFNCPMDLLIFGTVMYVSDALNNVIRRIDMANGTVSTYIS